MALKYREREEIVGKRFLCLQSHTNSVYQNNNKQNNKRTKLSDDCSQWQWKRGTVRAATHTDTSNTDLNILVEFDGVDWKKREWIRIYEQNAFQLFLIEYTLVWVNNKVSTIDNHILCPSLNFKALVDKIDFKQNKLKPIEYLVDKRLHFVDYNDLRVFQDSDLENQKAYIESPEVKVALRKWTEFQDSQRILLTTPSVLVGYRVKVYRSEGTTQWYTAVIVSYNENTRELTLTDDTVLEEHNEDPSLVQIKLIGDGVVESILKGEDIGITPRRRTCNQNQANCYSRNRSGTTGAINNSGNSCSLPVTTNSSSISSPSTTTTTQGNTSSNLNSINSSANNISSTLVTRKKLRRNSSDISTKDSPIPSPANTVSDNNSKGRVITTESKNSVNINRNVFEAIQRKSIKETKETTGNSGSDQQLLHSYKTKRSIHHKNKSDPKKLEPSQELDSDCTKSANPLKNSELNVEKSSDCVDNSGSSDTEIEDSLKSSNKHKKQNRLKRNRKKCSQSSGSDVDPSEEDNRPKVITTTTVANTCDNYEVNGVKGSQTICQINRNEKFEENSNKCYELKSRTQTSDSNSADVITSVECVPQISSDLSTTQNIESNKETIKSVQLLSPRESSDCNVRQMVPTMCSVEEQLNTSPPNDKSESFPTRPHVLNHYNSNDDKSSSLSLNSGPTSCVRVNSDNNNNNSNINTNHIKSETNNRNTKPIGESNDCLRPSSHSLALDRLESITVYRDPNLVDKQPIRHIDSVQHLRHGLMHSVNTTTASMSGAPEYSRVSSSGLQSRTCQPSILPPSVSSMAPQYKLKSQPIHSHSSHPLSTGSHGSLPHSNSVDPQIYHMMPTHPMVSGLSAQSIEMLWQQKGYSPLSSMPANSPWNLYNEQIRAQLLHNNNNDKQHPSQQYRIEREKRDDKEKHFKIERESKEYVDKERVRQELIGREKEENAKEAVDQHFEESLRLARQKKSGWSPISNLPLTKGQTNVSRQSHVLPQQQTQHSVSQHMSQQHQSIKGNVRYDSIDYERLSKDVETERWMAYMQQHPTQTHSSHSSRVNVAEAMARHQKSLEMGHQSRHLQSSMMCEPSNKGSHSLHSSTTSPVMEASKQSMTNRAKTEPSFSLYGYQPNQNISYITAAQLKENNRLNMSSNVSMSPLMTARTDLSKGAPPAAHGLDRRESPKIDRSLTPNSRNSTPLGRPPSLSPKQKSPKMMAPVDRMDRISPLYHRSQGQAIKQYDYSINTAPPAHQSTSSRSGTPLLSSSPISLQIQSQIPVAAHSSQTQEQPQNLVKSDSKSKLIVNEMTKSSFEIQRESPKTSSNVSTGYQSFSLIQQGLVPNPLYKASPTTQSTTGTTSMPSVITRPHSQPTKTSSNSLSPHLSQKSHMFTKPGPGIVSGIPICRPNSIPYYDLTQRTNLMNAQKYPQSLSAIRSDSINTVNTYPEMNRMAKLPTHSTTHSTTHSPYNQTQDRNISVFHRLSSSPHSPRISSGSVPPSPYGPPPGMVPVSSSVNQSRATPPAAHSGANAYNMNVKRKSIEMINISNEDNNNSNNNNNNSNNSNDYSHKKQRLIESPVPTQPSVMTTKENLVDNNCSNNIPIQCTPVSTAEVLSDLPTKSMNATIVSKDNSSESNSSIDFLSKHQKAVSVASRTSNPSTSSSPVNIINEDKSKPLEIIPSPASSSSSISSFHPKLKKAWLQRHSEDKTGVSSSANSSSSSASQNNNNNNIKNISENSNSSADTNKDKDIKVKSELSLNGSVDRKNLKDDDLSAEDETSSASETELSNSSKSSKRKAQTRGVRTRKRIHNQNKDKDNKKRKSNSESNKSDDSLKIGKENEEKKKKEKNKESDKESNDLRSTTPRRGRKPKALKNEDKDKSSKDLSSSSLKKKVQKGRSDRTAIAELKKSGAPFLQGGSCVEVAPKLPKCRECRMTPTQRNRKPTIFCRFYDYRKLAFKSNILSIAGFSQPQDATEDDLKLWLPSDDSPSDLDIETAKFVISHVGDQFCDLVKQEKEALLLHMGSTNKNTTWKRVVQGVREMCDVCETTLFNIHWVCDKCGFVVCIDCYKARKVGSIKEELCPAKDRDGFQWLLCNNRQQHEPQRLEVTQIIAASALQSVGRMLHTLRTKCNITSNCSCVSVKDINHKKSNGFTKQVLSVVKIDNKQMNGINDTNSKNWKSINGTVAIIKPENDPSLTGYSSESGNSPLSFFVDVALTSEKLISKSSVIKEENEQKTKKKSIKVEKDSELTSDDDDNKHSTLRELLMGPTSKSTKDNKPNGSPVNETPTNKKGNQFSEMDSIESETKDENCLKAESPQELQHFMRRYFPLRKEADPLPIICRILEETKKEFPQIPHNWFCEGRLLVLHEPKNSENIHLFQEQWIRGQPVLVKENHKNLSAHLWHPDSFSRDFGDIKNDLINCLNGDILSKQPMRKFWDGFESLQIRMKDKNGDFMLLKLKDWPPDEEFSELLPTRYRDLMSSLPLPEYTNRNGILNLAGRLPDCFVRPDLGPKMYSAYGSCHYPDKGTTNLHLDISDAVNVMIFVGVPKESHKTEKDYLQEVLNGVDGGGCDDLMKKRVREKGVKVGALWHIYNARDADKIRDLLNKVAIERGETPEPHHDPIHDQSWYLDEKLRSRLLKEYGVEGYAIAQCLGDAIFIPAGAPHQVRNLNSCVKVAGDFVSPENVSHCFHLTQEFRELSDTHTNHEDKLQIKNIIYHAVKDALSVLRNQPNDSN